MCGFAGYAVYLYFTYFYAPHFTRYPQPVAMALRRALYYTTQSPDTQLALKYYNMATQLSNELLLDPLSDEVMGIRIQISAWLQKIGNYKQAIDMLTTLSNDCQSWVAWMEKGIEDGTLDKSGMPPARTIPPELLEKVRTEDGRNPYEPEDLWGKRSRVLAKAVAINIKLGELHADEHVLEPEMAEKRLTWAVETLLKEMKRRQEQGVRAVEEKWLTADEIGGSFEGESTTALSNIGPQLSSC
jgi:hypothetical protein